jgi:hypothetical protein
MTRRAALTLLPLVALAVGATSRAAPPAESKAKVVRIVFVGKKHACDCTRKSIEAGRKVLQAALGKQSRYRLEELAIDVDGEKVDELRKKRALTALPAIYFFDGAGELRERLQGDITEAQIRAVLK